MCSHIPAKFPLRGWFFVFLFCFFVLVFRFWTKHNDHNRGDTERRETTSERGGGREWEETQHQVDEGKVKHSEQCDSWDEVEHHQFTLKLNECIVHALVSCVSVLRLQKIVFRWILERFYISTPASVACCVGGAPAMVRLSLFHRADGTSWYFSSQAPAHPVSKDRHRAHFLSVSLSHTVADIQWKKSALCSKVLETFSVAEVYNSRQ